MDGDAYRDMSHYEMQQMLWRKVASFADYAAIEHKLPNGKIADVFYQVDGIRIIVEVKTILRQSLIEKAWEKYRTQCAYLAIACPPQLVLGEEAPLLASWESELIGRVGIWWVDWCGITEIRPAYCLDVKTPGRIIHMRRASSPFAVIASPGCTARTP